MVDLAGCEKISKTGASGKTLEEAKKINLSLSELGQVINNLTKVKNDKQYVNFRNSILTMLLKESLGGNSKTALICTLSKQMVHLEESLSTLQFAKRAKKIKNNAVVNITKSPEEM